VDDAASNNLQVWLWNAVGLKTKTEAGTLAVGWVDEFENQVDFSYAGVHTEHIKYAQL
jgi:hypothetical protein